MQKSHQRVLFESSQVDPTVNLSIEELLMDWNSEYEMCCFLWKNEKTVVIGRHQNVYDEVDLSYAKQNSISIVRRNSGGGAVYHDKGNINFSVITEKCYSEEALNMLHRCITEVLIRQGIKTEVRGRNDIYVGEKKVAGIAQYYSENRALIHGCLLVQTELDVLNRVLTRNYKIKDSMAETSVYSKTANIADYEMVLTDDLVKNYMEYLIGKGFIFLSDNYPFEKDEIEELANRKYRLKEWNYGYIPEFDYINGKHYKGGYICVEAIIRDEVIQAIRFKGDFFTKKDISGLEFIMRGMVISENLTLDLENNGGDDYIIGITSRDIADLFSEIVA